jgi:hypothetical protein
VVGVQAVHWVGTEREVALVVKVGWVVVVMVLVAVGVGVLEVERVEREAGWEGAWVEVEVKGAGVGAEGTP